MLKLGGRDTKALSYVYDIRSGQTVQRSASNKILV